MRYLMWDIDGTLILTGGAGQKALKKVIKEYYFLDTFEFTNSLAGRTDSDIIKSVVTRLHGRCNVGEAASILIRYHMQLPHELSTHQGKILKNVEKTLAYFNRPESKFVNCLLSGNTRTGAQLKLGHYKLSQYFDFNHSVFGECSENRNDLAKIAFSRFYLEHHGRFTADDLVFIGDTPNDVFCAQAIGARCIIILDGSNYKVSDFEQCKPYKIINSLPDNPEELENLINQI